VRNATLPASIRDGAGPGFLALCHAAAGDARPLVFEAGCGHGRDMAWLEAAGVFVCGIDLSAGMLAQARRRAAGPLVQGDLRHLPLEPGRFHGAWCNAALLHLPRSEAPAALAGMRRRLVPGGGLFLTVQEGQSEGWHRGAYGDPDARRYFTAYTQDEVVALLDSAGFAVEGLAADAAGGRTWLQALATAAVGRRRAPQGAAGRPAGPFQGANGGRDGVAGALPSGRRIARDRQPGADLRPERSRP
jgi:SAM-dependent methyltransferase